MHIGANDVNFLQVIIFTILTKVKYILINRILVNISPLKLFMR